MLKKLIGKAIANALCLIGNGVEGQKKQQLIGKAIANALCLVGNGVEEQKKQQWSKGGDGSRIFQIQNSQECLGIMENVR